MVRSSVAVACLLLSGFAWAAKGPQPAYPHFDYEIAKKHEINPHRRAIPVDGVQPGFNQLRLTLTVSPGGDVIDSKADGNGDLLRFWPQLQSEVSQWKFTPFEKNSNAVTAEVEEYIDLVPPERLPKIHVDAPVLHPNSTVVITLNRSGCYGSCPSYSVTISNQKVIFNGDGFVVARGEHKGTIDPSQVRELAKKFIDADFYSMEDSYSASVTDCPSFVLSISVDRHSKKVVDYMGSWVGMPAVITELEDEVDSAASSQRWIEGSEGLVQALQVEGFNFKTYDAQVMLKESASRGQTATVQEFLAAGVPLNPFQAPKPTGPYTGVLFKNVGWLTAASRHPDTLKVLIDAGASKDDEKDKDLALAGAAESGNVEAARALIAYGANPNADLTKLIVTENGGGMTLQGPGAGSVLIYAAESGNPEMVREILRYHPKLEMRDREGKTAIFAAGEYRYGDKDGARVECVRLLAQAGANVNARDSDGNTPLHETFLTDVEEELLKLGANVNARNNDGETPIFTTVDMSAIPLFIRHGADLNLRNNKGQTVVEAAADKGPLRQEALRNAIASIGTDQPEN
ncbi:MAG TPA: ankyrin repeat domain-containing protein [Acidobacteriaceae bacterium]|nr:ankyrin repeat domain-containing protein [Acidobacteriaceae bacterium]